MMIDQRNAGATATITADPQYSIDRWKFGISQASKVSAQRSTVAPAGFSNSVLLTSLSAMTIGSSDYGGFQQDIEGFNIADLGWGTANAQPVTISFWVRSSLTGTFSGALRNLAQNRAYPFTFSISSANTWEYKTVTVAGDTSGTWLTDNTTGIRLSFNISTGSTYLGTAGSWVGSNIVGATGSVNLLATNGATFYITGVQLEKGSTATSFDYRPYGTELALCQRYFEKSYPMGTAIGTGGSGVFAITWNSYSFMRGTFDFKVNKRNAPALTFYNGTTGATGTVQFAGAGAKAATTATLTEVCFEPSGAGLWTANDYCYFHWSASSEL
jgi:hypothetical protein